jgi:hypothetical protein
MALLVVANVADVLHIRFEARAARPTVRSL